MKSIFSFFFLFLRGRAAAAVTFCCRRTCGCRLAHATRTRSSAMPVSQYTLSTAEYDPARFVYQLRSRVRKRRSLRHQRCQRKLQLIRCYCNHHVRCSRSDAAALITAALFKFPYEPEWGHDLISDVDMTTYPNFNDWEGITGTCPFCLRDHFCDFHNMWRCSKTSKWRGADLPALAADYMTDPDLPAGFMPGDTGAS